MNNISSNINNHITTMQRVLMHDRVDIIKYDVDFSDHDALVLGFELDELRTMIDALQNDIDNRVRIKRLHELI